MFLLLSLSSTSFLTTGDFRHHDLLISLPCPPPPRSCPAPLISYRPYHIELTTLTMTKANPMYLIVGGSHPHAFLHDRRMIGRNLQNEWGSISYKPDTATQVVLFPSLLIPVCSSILSAWETSNSTTKCSYHSL